MNNDCSVYSVSNLIGKRWTLLLVLELYKGENKWKRFNQLKAKLPQITSKMLSARLKELEKEGILQRRIDSSVVPIKSEYSLTKRGEEFLDVIKHLKDWSLKSGSNKSCKSKDCKNCEF
jgi:DNA-binding HxlR family transcriptional regulator